MTKEENFNEVIELFQEKNLLREDCYIGVSGEWVEFQFSDVLVCINFWLGIVEVQDSDTFETIYRVE